MHFIKTIFFLVSLQLSSINVYGGQCADQNDASPNCDNYGSGGSGFANGGNNSIGGNTGFGGNGQQPGAGCATLDDNDKISLNNKWGEIYGEIRNRVLSAGGDVTGCRNSKDRMTVLSEIMDLISTMAQDISNSGAKWSTCINLQNISNALNTGNSQSLYPDMLAIYYQMSSKGQNMFRRGVQITDAQMASLKTGISQTQCDASGQNCQTVVSPIIFSLDDVLDYAIMMLQKNYQQCKLKMQTSLLGGGGMNSNSSGGGMGSNCIQDPGGSNTMVDANTNMPCQSGMGATGGASTGNNRVDCEQASQQILNNIANLIPDGPIKQQYYTVLQNVSQCQMREPPYFILKKVFNSLPQSARTQIQMQNPTIQMEINQSADQAWNSINNQRMMGSINPTYNNNFNNYIQQQQMYSPNMMQGPGYPQNYPMAAGAPPPYMPNMGQIQAGAPYPAQAPYPAGAPQNGSYGRNY
jgi:hypothetical protein